jgi:hypothetical protein
MKHDKADELFYKIVKELQERGIYMPPSRNTWNPEK